jgi:hypothetical protein
MLYFGDGLGRCARRPHRQPLRQTIPMFGLDFLIGGFRGYLNAPVLIAVPYHFLGSRCTGKDRWHASTSPGFISQIASVLEVCACCQRLATPIMAMVCAGKGVRSSPSIPRGNCIVELLQRWILLENALSQKRRMTSHIRVDIGYVVVLHRHLVRATFFRW